MHLSQGGPQPEAGSVDRCLPGRLLSGWAGETLPRGVIKQAGKGPADLEL